MTGFFRKDRGNLPAIAYGVLGALYLFVVYYSRQSHLFGAPTNYLYLEVGGSLLCFCYAANALVRFRGTHDRIALILAFGFVLSGMIETIGYFGLNNLLRSGTVALSHVPMGWMVGRTMLAVLLLAALAVERFIPTARQPSAKLPAPSSWWLPLRTSPAPPSWLHRRHLSHKRAHSFRVPGTFARWAVRPGRSLFYRRYQSEKEKRERRITLRLFAVSRRAPERRLPRRGPFFPAPV